MFAEYFTLPVGNLRVVPKAVSNDVAVFTEPVAAACEILDQVKIPRGGEVALLGYGKLGRLIEQVLAAHGCQVRVFERDASKRGRFRWVVEATGTAEGFSEAIAMTEPRGTLILKSTVHGAVPVDAAAVGGKRNHHSGVALRAIRAGPHTPEAGEDSHSGDDLGAVPAVGSSGGICQGLRAWHLEGAARGLTFSSRISLTYSPDREARLALELDVCGWP